VRQGHVIVEGALLESVRVNGSLLHLKIKMFIFSIPAQLKTAAVLLQQPVFTYYIQYNKLYIVLLQVNCDICWADNTSQ
jgi:hypothetical protein